MKRMVLLAVLGLALVGCKKKAEEGAAKGKNEAPAAASNAGESSTPTADPEPAADAAAPAPKREWYCLSTVEHSPCVLNSDTCAEHNNGEPCEPVSPVHCFEYRHAKRGDSISCHPKDELCAKARELVVGVKDSDIENLTACAPR